MRDVNVEPASFSVTRSHLQKLDEMKDRLGVSRSEVVRQLIEAATLEKLEKPAA